MNSNIKKTTFDVRVAIICLLSIGIRILGRGIFWFKEQDEVIDDSNFYQALHEVLPIWFWGFLLSIGGMMFIFAAVLLGLKSKEIQCSILLLIGGIINFVVYFIMASASMYNAINWLTPVHMVIMTTTCFVIAVSGGVRLAKFKRTRE
ncbi:hypothetical protein NGB74_02410 [Staphylococcus chromogenes]|uniref:hypothetical protein n=1 Tax=Staphylococcus chromogenes TaxID=46126 RepID=UPI002DC00665|nr:hypothetical protein [Staphylococcus chromogenes]MEB7449862.1 hypothetical protein [Staphylococcus chromogenes]